jgi:hypothetical protein
VIKPFLGTTSGLKETPATLDGQAVLIREASLLERAEFQRIGREIGQPEAIAYYIERRILWPNGEPIYTKSEALRLAQTPAEQAEQLFAITALLLGEKKRAPESMPEASPAPNGSNIASH